MTTALARGLAAASLALPLSAQNVKLNGPLARAVSGWIYQGVTSPDGLTHVYSADHDGDGDTDLFATASNGKEPRWLLATSDVAGHAVTPDGRRVLHSVDWDGNGTFELAVVPLDASAPPRLLTGLLPFGGAVRGHALAPDGVQLVYLADEAAYERRELFTVSLEGGLPVRLSGALGPDRDVRAFELARNAPLALYLADADADEVAELYLVPVDGSQPPRKLPIPLVAGGDVVDFAFDADASHVLYTADQDEDERFELFRIATDGTRAPQRLSGPLVPGGDVGATPDGLATSLDRRWIVYPADAEVDERFDVYGVAADGSAPPRKLIAEVDPAALVLALSWDSSWVVYQPESGGDGTLFSVPIDGSAPPRQLSGSMVPGGAARLWQIAHDSSRVVYVGDQEADEVYELFSAPIDGSTAPVKLNAPLPPGGDIAYDRRSLLPGFYVMSDGVMYLADQEVEGRTELYFAALDGGAPPRKLAAAPVESSAYPDVRPHTVERGLPPGDFGRVLFQRDQALWSVAVAPGAEPIAVDRPEEGGIAGRVELFRATPSGERVIYVAREEGDQVAELYSVPADEPQRRVQLLSDLQFDDFVAEVELVPDGSRVVLRAALGGRAQLYSVAAAGGEAPRVLGPLLGLDDFLHPGFVLTRDGDRVLFTGTLAGEAVLHVAPVDGSAPPLRLAAQAPLGALRVSADGSRAAYVANGLRVVPTDGSTAAVRVSASGQLVEGDFQLAPDGARAVYRTNGDAIRVGELFAAASDGSAAPLRISDAMPAHGDVTTFALAADGTRALYLADPGLDGRFELFAVPLDGGAPPVRLHPELGGDADVLSFAIAPDSRRAVYLADADVDGRFELFAVPLDGSDPPVRLNAGLAPGGTVAAPYQITPDARRVVYLARRGAGQATALFSTSIRGARGGVKLSRELLPGGDVRTFRISADSSTVAFTAERESSGATTLLAVPITGVQKAMELAGPFVNGGTVHDLALAADGARATYSAGQEIRGVVELYGATYARAARASKRP